MDKVFMIKIDWMRLLNDRMGTWTILGFYIAILVVGGQGPDSGRIVGHKICWSWYRWNEDTPNWFRIYDRAEAIRRKKYSSL